MRTTIDIPEDLIEEAMKLTGAKTKSQLVKDALQEQIQRVRRKRILAFKGKIDLDLDLEMSRDRQ